MAADEGMGVEMVGSCWVKPAKPTKRHNYFLSGLDIFWSDYGYARTLHFYEVASPSTSLLMERLKRSLSEVLVHYYPVAGRLALARDHGDGQEGEAHEEERLVVDCNDAGVEFIEARSHNVSYAHLRAANDFAPQKFFNALSRPGGLHPQHPILSVQVTCFLDGGIAIGCSSNHSVFDGFSFWSFIKSWAECCSNLIGDSKQRCMILANPPIHMRTTLSLRALSPSDQPTEVVYKKGSNTIVSKRQGYVYYSLLGQLREEEQGRDNVQVYALHLTTKMVNEIKATANRDRSLLMNEHLAPFTSFVCLSAYLWKRRILANTCLADAQQVGLRFRANIRPRLIPPLPPNYFGVATMHIVVYPPPTTGELRRESLSATAARIDHAIKLYTCHESIKEEIKKYEEGDMKKITAFAAYWPGAQINGHESSNIMVTEINDSRRTPMYDADFGWGNPDAVRPTVNRGERGIVLGPGKGDHGSVDIFANLKSPELEAFLSFDGRIE